ALHPLADDEPAQVRAPGTAAALVDDDRCDDIAIRIADEEEIAQRIVPGEELGKFGAHLRLEGQAEIPVPRIVAGMKPHDRRERAGPVSADLVSCRFGRHQEPVTAYSRRTIFA